LYLAIILANYAEVHLILN